MSSTALRRSAGRTGFPVMLAVVATHLVLRDRTWTHEWLWAIYQLGFVTVLLGPLVSGVAAWEGWRLSSAADSVATSVRPRRCAALAWKRPSAATVTTCCFAWRCTGKPPQVANAGLIYVFTN